MTNQQDPSSVFGDAFLQAIRQAVREELRAVIGNHGNKAADPNEKQYLSVKQAAEVSGLGASTIRLLIRKRQLWAQKVGRRVLIKRTDLERFLEAEPIRAAQI